MPAQTRVRRQASLNINAFNNKIVQTLGRGMIYREIMLRFSGTFTYAAAANNSNLTLGRGDEWSAIARVDLVVNGTDIVRSFSGTQLFLLNRLMYGGIKRTTTQLGDGVTAAPTFQSTLIMPIWQPLSVKPMDTALDSSQVSDMRIEVTVDASSSVNTAAGPTAIAATLDVSSYECFGIDGQFSDCRMYNLQSVQAGANQNTQIQLPVTALYRGFIINVANGSGNAATDLPLVPQNVQLISGTTIFRDIAWQTLLDWQRMRLGWSREFQVNAAQSPVLSQGANGIYMNLGKSALCFEDAWAFMDLCQDGYLGEGIDSVGFSELYLNINVNAASTITVIPIQIFPRRKAAAA